MRTFIKTRGVSIVCFLLVVFCMVCQPCHGAAVSSLADDALARVRFDQRLNQQISLDLQFVDETGKTVRLGDYFNKKPVILVLGYYGCPMLCTLVLNGMVECLLNLKSDIGNQFEVVQVSIDPSETPEIAAAKKRTYLKRYGRRGAESGWHFLTGEAPAIKKLAAEVGFGYAYDPGIKQYAHPSGFIVLTPNGKVARYFFGVNFPAKELGVTLREAAVEHTGSPVEQLLLLCFHYNPLRGKYGALIMTVFRVGGLLTVGALFYAVFRIRQRDALAPRSNVPGGGSAAADRKPEPAGKEES